MGDLQVSYIIPYTLDGLEDYESMILSQLGKRKRSQSGNLN